MVLYLLISSATKEDIVKRHGGVSCYGQLTPVDVRGTREKPRYIPLQNGECRVEIFENADDRVVLLDRRFGPLQGAVRVERQTVDVVAAEEHRLPPVITDALPRLPLDVLALPVAGENAPFEVLLQPLGVWQGDVREGHFPLDVVPRRPDVVVPRDHPLDRVPHQVDVNGRRQTEPAGEQQERAVTDRSMLFTSRPAVNPLIPGKLRKAFTISRTHSVKLVKQTCLM